MSALKPTPKRPKGNATSGTVINGAPSIDDLRATQPGGVLTGSGSWNLTDATGTANLSGTTLALAVLIPAEDGTLESRVRLDDVSFAARVADDVAHITASTPDYGATLNGRVTLAGSWPFEGRLAFSDTDIAAIGRLAGASDAIPDDISASFDATIEASGAARDIAAADATLSVTRLDGLIRDRPVALVQAGRLQLQDGRVRVAEPLSLTWGSTSLALTQAQGPAVLPGVAVSLEGALAELTALAPGMLPEGLAADLDRVQHMFFHDRKDVVYDWYRRLDRFVGHVSQMVEQGTGKYRYLLLSDHGFSDFRKKIHLNRWLVDNNYLCMENGGDDLSGVDWSKSRAYAVGLNSIYLNVSGREGKGCVAAEEIEGLLSEIQTKLSDWKDEEGTRIVQRVRFKHETFNGPFTRFGPDLVVGYAPGNRASAETGLGKIPSTALEPNHERWGADHCIEAEAVPGVIFANRDLAEFGGISFRDIPLLAIGKHLDQSHIKPPFQAAGAGQKDVEERLKGLGYL